MNDKSIKNISTKDLYMSRLIEIVDEVDNDAIIGKKLTIGDYVLVKKNNNADNCVDILTNIEYRLYNQWDTDKYNGDETRVSIMKPMNIDEAFISHYDAAKLIRSQRITDGGEDFKKAKVKKIGRKED